MIATCPHCESGFYCAEELAGQTVTCSRCNKPVQAPDRRAKKVVNNPPSMANVVKANVPKATIAKVNIAKPGPDSDKKVTSNRKTVNLRKGIRRLAIVLSLLPMPIAFIIALKNDYILYSFEAPFLNKPLDLFLGFPVFFVAIWAAYGLGLFVTKGFRNAKDKQDSEENKQPQQAVHKQPQEPVPKRNWRTG